MQSNRMQSDPGLHPLIESADHLEGRHEDSVSTNNHWHAHYLRYITPALFNLSKSSELIITTVLGGLGSLTGSVLGTIIVQLLPEIFRSLAEYRMLVYGIAVVLVILVRPNGLYGYREFSLKRVITFVTARLGKGAESHE